MPKNMTTVTRKRKIVMRTILSGISVIVLAFIGTAYASWQWDRIIATVTNKSSQTVDNVELHKSSGGLYALGKLEPGESKSVWINPKGKAVLRASFWNGDQIVEQNTNSIYIEGSGGYRPKLTIGNGSAMRWSYGRNFLWPPRP